MTKNVYSFVERMVSNYKIAGIVLDIGSMNINGSVKAIFKGCNYIGLDMREGWNVDVVANAHAIPMKDGDVDCVVCCDTLEHDDDFFQTIKEIKRVLKMGGWFILCVPSFNFPLHEFPNDYWRFTKEGVKILLREFEIEVFDEDRDEFFTLNKK